ncbi:oxygen-independent coproporphyrinogen III oxidase, partial [bacterium]|nr:oxygen-independent coproporphyrinogen III oxidase [bacterium]
GEFENLSIDLIIGLPGCDEKILRNTIEKAVSLPITHISVYFLMVHSKTPLFYKLQDGTEALPSKIDWNTVYYDVVEFLRQHGFAQYEISNFARPTFESVHNKAYWSREAYKGFGVGAASFDGNTRTVNNKNITGYIDVVRRGELPVDFCEALTFEQEKLERVMLGLRQTRGMSLVDLMALLGDSKTAFIARIDQLKERGVLREDECGRVSLTLEGMPLENEVVAFLCG